MQEIKKIEIEDKEYPKVLKKIEDPPKVLYFRGNFDITKKPCFAIVGTRRCSSYGKQVALEIAGDLATAGLVIVSGMAQGIDTFSHKGCLERRGKTIAVLGTGLDEKSIYPQTNLELARKIIETGGVLISEYPTGFHGSKITFPQRNRIIAGLSLGTLIIEAKKRSGALITAHWARKQEKTVFAVPGPVHSLNSWGPNYLIKKGAKLVTSVNDILEELNLSPNSEISKRQIKGETIEENVILEALKEENMCIDKIIEKTNLAPATVASTLTVLEIKNKVRNLGGNIYAIMR